jgi:hypothetical protein
MDFNPSDKSSKEVIFDRLRLMRECPLCGGAYQEKQVEIIEENGSGHLVHITCDQCQNAILSLVVVSQIGMSSVGIVTDLSAIDARRLQKRPPVSEDVVLNFHQYLKSNDLVKSITIKVN